MKKSIYNFFAAISLLFIVGANTYTFAQYCVSGCNGNTYVESNDPKTIEYDNMVSVFHSAMAKEYDGTLKVWGQGALQNGQSQINNALTPQIVNSANYGSGANQLSGTILKFAGGSNVNQQQFAVLTTNGLYIWGGVLGTMVPLNSANNVASGSFRKANVATVGNSTLKTDGLPTNQLANVVDDHLMEITHVIRGEEWLNSAPKHQLLYEYFGWEMPVLCHMPLLRNPDKSKLSKRKNPTSITYYRDAGVLPEALLNYLGRMGYSMPDDKEIFTLEERIASFDITRVSLGGPIFDIEKLNWLNGEWLRALTPEQLKNKILDWANDSDKLTAIAAAIQPRIHLLSDAVNWAGFYFQNLPNITVESFEHKSLTPEQIMEILQIATWKLETLPEWTEDNIFATLKGLSGAMDIKLRDMMAPFFIAIAGNTSSTPVMNSMYVIGADMTLTRLRHAVEVLGGIGKKKLKKLEKTAADMPDFLADAE